MLLSSAALCFAASSARAADAVYWTNELGAKISFVNLDSSAGGDITTAGATISEPAGVAIDPAAGRIYWANLLGNKISFAKLDGSGGGDLPIAGATVSGPYGVAIDPAAGRIYWANLTGEKISFAKLDGSGGGDLPTTGATVSDPEGVAIDPAAGRIYWANALANKISFANLSGTGGGDLNTAGASGGSPGGVAVDPAAGRIYWANGIGGISFARLDGTGGGDLNTGAASVNGAQGVAVDPAAGRIYWGNTVANKVSFAKLDGGGGGDLPTLAATVSAPAFPALLLAPAGSGAPQISGGSVVGSTLSCSPGSWAPDLLGSFLYRAPQGLAYTWSRNGANIAGATSGSITASSAGEYRCQVTATNHAGSTAQISAPYRVSSTRPNTKITKARVNRKKRKATFRFRAVGESTGFRCALLKRHRKHSKPRFKRCRSPKTYRHLKPGKYTFEVRAISVAGPDPTPAKRRFKI